MASEAVLGDSGIQEAGNTSWSFAREQSIGSGSLVDQYWPQVGVFPPVGALKEPHVSADLFLSNLKDLKSFLF